MVYTKSEIIKSLTSFEFGKFLTNKANSVITRGDGDALGDDALDTCMGIVQTVAGKNLLTFSSMPQMRELLDAPNLVLTSLAHMLEKWSAIRLQEKHKHVLTVLKVMQQIASQADFVIAQSLD